MKNNLTSAHNVITTTAGLWCADKIRPMHDQLLRILQFTDTHIFADPAQCLADMNTVASFNASVAAALALRNPVDLVLVTGDLAAEGEADAYRWLADQLEEFSAPIHCIPGNHDVPEIMNPIVEARDWGTKTSMVAGAWHFVFLNSAVPGEQYGLLGSDEIERLEIALASESQRPTMLVLHHNPLPLGTRWLDTMTLRDAEPFWDVIARHDQVRAVMFGHVHQNFDTYHNDVRLLAAPSTCVQFAPRATQFALDPVAPGFRWLNCYSDGTIDTDVVRVSPFEVSRYSGSRK